MNGTGQRIRRSGLPYLHALDGIISVLHRTDLLVHGLVRQQQLVKDLQRPGPVPDRFQRHDPYEKLREGIPGALAPICDGFRRYFSRPVASGCVKSGVNRESRGVGVV